MENFRLLGMLQFAGTLGILLVYIGGVLVSGLIIRRGARQGGVLTLVGFALLLFGSLCSWITNFIVFPQMSQGMLGPAHFLILGLNSLVSIVGLILIVLGIWHLGTRGTGAAAPAARRPIGQEARIEPALEPERTPPDETRGGAQAFEVPDREDRDEPLP
jgi:hypothetical protein